MSASPGSHSFGGDYNALAEQILQEARPGDAPAGGGAGAGKR